jgi:hypothetical protein
MAWPTKTDFVDGDVLTAAQVNNIGTNLNVFNPTSATNGQVWIANGSGGGAYGTAGGGMTLITSGSLAGVNTVTLSSIPGTYEHLELNIFEAYTSTINQVLVVNPNNAATGARAVGFYQYGDALTTFVGQADNSANPGNIEELVYTPSSATTRAFWSYRYLNYAQATNNRKVITSTSLGVKIGTSNVTAQGFAVGTVDITAAITSLVLSTLGGTNFTAGTYELWGIK